MPWRGPFDPWPWRPCLGAVRWSRRRPCEAFRRRSTRPAGGRPPRRSGWPSFCPGRARTRARTRGRERGSMLCAWGLLEPSLEGLEPSNQLPQPPRPAPFAIKEADARLIRPRMIDDAARQIERRLAARRHDLEDDVRADRRLQLPAHETAAHADLAELDLAELERRRDPDLARDPDGDARVLALPRRGTLAAQGLHDEVPLGRLLGFEGHRRAGADAHAGQGRAPGGDVAADEHLVRQSVARHLDDDRGSWRELGRRGTKNATVRHLGKVVLLEFFEVPAADAKDVQEG